MPAWLSWVNARLLVLAQVMISQSVGLSSVSGSVLSLLGMLSLSLSLSLSAPPLLTLSLNK